MSDPKPELKACPFCGRQVKHGWQGSGVPGMEDCGYWFAGCPTCQIIFHCDSEGDAIKAWNTRAPDDRDREIERLRNDNARYAEVCFAAKLNAEADNAEKARLRAQLEASQKACAEMRDAIDAKIQGKSVWGYLHEQFPATHGHIPLRDYMRRLGNALVTAEGRDYIPRERLEEAMDIVRQIKSELGEEWLGALLADEGTIHYRHGDVTRVQALLDRADQFLAQNQSQP